MTGVEKIYKSEIDYKIYNFVMLITLLSISPVFFVARFSVTLYIVLGLVVGSLWLTHTVFHGIRYAINPENRTLSVKIGFFKHGTYDIMEIKSIKKTNTWLSSPAASMDRIAIKIKFSPLVISPQNRMEFINDLLSLNPEIEVADDLLG